MELDSRNTAFFERAIAVHKMARFPSERVIPGTPGAVLLEFEKRAVGCIQRLRNQAPTIPPIHFGFVEDARINACVFTYRNEYVIAVNLGTVAILLWFFTRTLADPRFFRNVGNPDLEKPQNVSPRPMFPDMDRMMGHLQELVIPIGRERLDFADALIHRAFQFLFDHELAHILDGHLGLWGSAHAPLIAELTAGISDRELLDRQGFEMDADHAAICNCLSTLLPRIAPKRESDPALSNMALFNPWEAFCACFFAIHSIFRFYGDPKLASHDVSAQAHPPMRIRQKWFEITASGFIREKSARPDLEAVAVSASRHALLMIEEAFAAFSGAPVKVVPFSEITELTKAHAVNIAEHWRTSLRKRLLPYAFVHLPE